MSNLNQCWARFKKWLGWGEPFRIELTITHSPDWERYD